MLTFNNNFSSFKMIKNDKYIKIVIFFIKPTVTIICDQIHGWCVSFAWV